MTDAAFGTQHSSATFDARRVKRRRIHLALKRIIDVFGAAAALVLAAPVLLAILLALSAGPGSPFFLQTRVGRDGRRFRCIKFRTMRPGAEAELGPILAGAAGADWRRRQKLVRDPRVTPLGGVLRRWGLDELPQFVNVLRGEMSLVGPRPVIAPETPGYPADRAYAESAAFAAYRSVRPGLTGLWQVSGGAETAHALRVRLDQTYAAKWSLWLDLKIILATPGAILKRSHG